jgi:hypothetical protein
MNLSSAMEHCRAGMSDADEDVQRRSSIPKLPWWRAADKAAMEDCRAGRETDMRCSKK